MPCRAVPADGARGALQDLVTGIAGGAMASAATN